MEFTYHTPTEVRFGRGVVDELPSVMKELGACNVVVVTGKTAMRKTGILDRVTSMLEKQEVTVFDEVENDPSVDTVDRGAEVVRGSDAIIALGGGSPMDAAKAMSVVSANGGTSIEYLRGCGVGEPGPPLVAVPTTSGTGSEVTEVSVLSDVGNRVKKSFRSRFMYPTVALDDPELTVSMPTSVTASSGLDALTHAIEAHTSNRHQPIGDVLCMEAAKVVLENLTTAYRDGGNMEARERMMLAGLMAGYGITHAGAGVAHGLSYSLWRVTGISHGLACGTVLPYVMRFNMECTDYAGLARHCGLQTPEELVEKVEEINEILGVPATLGELGVKEEHIPEMVEVGLSGSTRSNPRPVDEKGLAELIKNMI